MISIERLSFFRVTGGGVLRFAEHAPEGSGKAHAECNCTKSVRTRPTGSPVQIQQEFYVEGDGWSFRLAQRWCTFGELGGNEHAYIIFSKDFNNAQIEVVPVPGCGLTDAFFGHVYLGNCVDVSEFYNGFAPSRVVKLDEIYPHQVWTHACCFGKEAVRSFSDDGAEAGIWRERFLRAATVDRFLRSYRNGTLTPVSDLRDRLTADVTLITEVQALHDLLQPLSIVEELQQTETFRLCEEARQQVEPRKAVNDFVG